MRFIKPFVNLLDLASHADDGSKESMGLFEYSSVGSYSEPW